MLATAGMIVADSTLIVASDTTSPLCTSGPVPTDGQAEWHLCPVTRIAGQERHQEDLCTACVPDGPYPFTVAVWQEDGCDHGGCGFVTALVEVTGPSHHADACRSRKWGPPMTGCTDDHGDVRTRVPHDHPDKGPPVVAHCHPDAAPDCWHTPTGTVTRLDVPVPMERPSGPCIAGHHEDGECRICGPCPCKDVPAVSWWASLNVEANDG